MTAELPAQLARLANELEVRPGASVLDYGCADMPYRHLFPPDADFAGADLPGNPRATIEIAPDGTLPVDEASVDVVLSTQVLEHVADPRVYLSECFRVLRPGGQILLSTHGTFLYHPDPVDYWRWTCEGLRRVVSDAGLEVVRWRGIVGLGATGLQLFQDSWHYRLPGPLKHVLALAVQALMRMVDRLESGELRDLNASVFALIARKP